jgi:alanine racemase
MTRHAAGRETTRAWVEVDLGALRQNGVTMRARAGVPLLPMVKADAYGLGALRAVEALEPVAPWGYGVATVDEGVELRDAGVRRPIVVFTPLWGDDLGDAAAARLTPALGRAEAIARWGASGPWHLAVDTGMNRSGARWDELDVLRQALAASPPEGAFTHFHSADLDDGTMELQERRFCDAVSGLPARPPILHVDNGAAVERRRGTPWDLVRPGIFLYGVSCSAAAEVRPRPVAHVRARVVDLRTARDGETVSYQQTYRVAGDRAIATVAIGYADGYRRALSNRSVALLNGRRVQVVGLVTMDMTMLDVTGVPCAVGDVATLIGADGDDLLDAGTVARTAEISPYELLTGLRARLPRVYRDAADA